MVMPHILRHICFGALLAAVLPTAAAHAGNVIHLVEPSSESTLEDVTLFSQHGVLLDMDAQDSVLDVIQFGERLTAEVRVQGIDNHMLIQQVGYGQVVRVAQTGLHNTLVVSQGN